MVKSSILKGLGIALLAIGASFSASADGCQFQNPNDCPSPRLGGSLPEINPASGANALALLSGALLIFRSRRRRA
jgi:hypothetical protein